MQDDSEMMDIRVAESKDELFDCFEVIQQLRPHLEWEDFLGRYQSQSEFGYEIACLLAGDKVVAVAGYVFRETLGDGYFLNVDDLITDEAARSRGYGSELLEWLISLAAEKSCTGVHLDSHVRRTRAHRFYEREGFVNISRHFRYSLEDRET